jgi:hypothetical protein
MPLRMKRLLETTTVPKRRAGLTNVDIISIGMTLENNASLRLQVEEMMRESIDERSPKW